jgi:hypothetical protein
MAYNKGYPRNERDEPFDEVGENELAMPNNGNVSRLLNQVEKELAIMGEELGGLSERLSVVTMSMPSESYDDQLTETPSRPMSPLAEGIDRVLSQVRQANTRIRAIKAGVDL